MNLRCLGTLCASALVALAAVSARADGNPASISWNGWRITSSENLWQPSPYRYFSKRGLRYPLTHLVDGNPATAWVYSDRDRPWGGSAPKTKSNGTLPRRSQPLALTISGPRPFFLDGIRLMNGYNKSGEAFRRNNRVVRARILVNGEPVKTVSLADRPGWHTITLPRRRARGLTLELIDVRRGPEDDVCLSEIALYDRGRRIKWNLPATTVFSPGQECCGSSGYLMRRDGTFLARAYVGEGLEMAWSPNRRYVAGADSELVNHRSSNRLWVADAARGRIIFQQRPRVLPQSLAWKDNHQLVVTTSSLVSPGSRLSPAKFASRTRTLRVR